MLLDLLARVDHYALEHVLVEHCGLQILSDDENKNGTDDLRDVRLYFTLHGAYRDNKRSADNLYRLFTQLQAPPSAEFVITTKRVARCGAPNLAPSQRRLDIPIIVTVASRLSGYTGHIQEALSALDTLRSEYGGWRFPVRIDREATAGKNFSFECAFALEQMHVDIDANVLSPDDAEMVATLVDSGEGLSLPTLVLRPHVSKRDGVQEAVVLGDML